jgi:hypothetical protein
MFRLFFLNNKPGQDLQAVGRGDAAASALTEMIQAKALTEET